MDTVSIDQSANPFAGALLKEMDALLLIEGQDLSEQTLELGDRGWSTSVLGFAVGGAVLHVRAGDRQFFPLALDRVAQVPGVTRVLTLALELK